MGVTGGDTELHAESRETSTPSRADGFRKREDRGLGVVSDPAYPHYLCSWGYTVHSFFMVSLLSRLVLGVGGLGSEGSWRGRQCACP